MDHFPQNNERVVQKYKASIPYWRGINVHNLHHNGQSLGLNALIHVAVRPKLA